MIKCGGECSGVTGWPARSVDGSDVMTARAEGHAISCLQITPLLITSTSSTAGEGPRNSIYRDFLKCYVEFFVRQWRRSRAVYYSIISLLFFGLTNLVLYEQFVQYRPDDKYTSRGHKSTNYTQIKTAAIIQPVSRAFTEVNIHL